MKKLAVILMAIVLVFTMVACNQNPIIEDDSEDTKPVVPTEAETTPDEDPDEDPDETPVESPVDSDTPDVSEPEASETEPDAFETDPESESVAESETAKKGTIELPRDEF